MRNLIYKNRYTALLLLSVSLLGACKKDELESQDLLVFMTGEYGSYNNEVVIPFVHTPIDVSGNSIVKLAVSATREVAADVDVTLTPDTTLVAQYNKANKTNALALPASAYKIVNPKKYKIPSGKQTSDSVEIEITTPAALTNPGGYLLPLTINSIEGADRGVKISANRRTAYLFVTYAFNNIQATQVPVAGTLGARTGWVSTVSNTTSGALGPAMLDGVNTTYWRSSNSSSAAKWVSIDMGSVQEIKGIRINPNYTSANENATSINVSTSQDNITWTAQGAWKGTGPATGSTAANPDLKGINFIAPIQARYFRLDITAWVGGSRVGIGELNVIK